MLYSRFFSIANDVLINGKKICGILTETTAGKENYSFVGIGLNVNQKKFPKSVSGKTTSLAMEKNLEYNIKKISYMIIMEFNKLYYHYNKNDYSKIINEWKKNSHTLGKKVKVKMMNKTYTGKAVDVDKDCNLILKLNNGKMKKIVEGDIFVESPKSKI